jgi:hypothetical protein
MAGRRFTSKLDGDGWEEYSVHLDTSSDEWYSRAASTWGFGNLWTISCWASWGGEALFEFVNGGSNTIQVLNLFFPPEFDNTMFIGVQDSVGGLLKFLGWTAVWGTQEARADWKHLVFRFNGGAVGDPLDLHIDGVQTAPDNVQLDTTGTMTDTSRQFAWGSQAADDGSWTGNMGPFAIWNKILTGAEITEIWNKKFSIDLTQSSGSYTSSANLQHYYRPGWNFKVGNLDEGNGATRNLTAHNLTTADIEKDAP